ncbi:MAG: HD-GYP domain-containing protein [candidate division NC10 bacterium]|nr:HD-GYP domain-containing protein [candidate division NC10 bacterium]
MSPGWTEQVETFVRSVNAALRGLALYPASHPAAGKFFEKVGEALGPLLSDADRFTVSVLDGDLVVKGAPILGGPDVHRGLAERLVARGVGSLTLLRGVTAADLQRLLQCLTQDVASLQQAGGIGAVLARDGVTRIQVTGPTTVQEPGEESEALDLLQSRLIYNNARNASLKVFEEARLGRVPSSGEVKATVQGMVDGVLKSRHSLLALTMMKSYDEYLFNHSVNVGILSIALGRHLGYSGEVLYDLGVGAFLHDLGKVSWPDAIYNKPRDLSEEEWRIVKSHPEEGVKLTSRMEGISPVSLRPVLEHHMRHDRTGYPLPAPDYQIHPFGMIVQTADVYDAITTARPYQTAMEPTRAIARMKELAATVFDPAVLEKFIEMLGIYPAGTVVRLDTGELALVLRPNREDSARPVLRILRDPAGNDVPEKREVDLLEKDPATGAYRRSILVAVDPASKGIDVSQWMVEESQGGKKAG